MKKIKGARTVKYRGAGPTIVGWPEPISSRRELMTNHRNSARHVELGDFKTTPEALSRDRNSHQKKSIREASEHAETPRMKAWPSPVPRN